MAIRKRNAKFIIDILASKVSLLALGLITAWLGLSVTKEMLRKHEFRQEIAKLQQEILELEQKNNSLSSFVDSFQDLDVIELEAKKRLNLKKAGEEVAVILRGKDDESNVLEQVLYEENEASLSTPDEDMRLSILDNPMKWWEYITSNK